MLSNAFEKRLLDPWESHELFKAAIKLQHFWRRNENRRFLAKSEQSSRSFIDSTESFERIMTCTTFFVDSKQKMSFSLTMTFMLFIFEMMQDHYVFCLFEEEIIERDEIVNSFTEQIVFDKVFEIPALKPTNFRMFNSPIQEEEDKFDAPKGRFHLEYLRAILRASIAAGSVGGPSPNIVISSSQLPPDEKISKKSAFELKKKLVSTKKTSEIVMNEANDESKMSESSLLSAAVHLEANKKFGSNNLLPPLIQMAVQGNNQRFDFSAQRGDVVPVTNQSKRTSPNLKKPNHFRQNSLNLARTSMRMLENANLVGNSSVRLPPLIVNNTSTISIPIIPITPTVEDDEPGDESRGPDVCSFNQQQDLMRKEDFMLKKQRMRIQLKKGRAFCGIPSRISSLPILLNEKNSISGNRSKRDLRVSPKQKKPKALQGHGEVGSDVASFSGSPRSSIFSSNNI